MNSGGKNANEKLTHTYDSLGGTGSINFEAQWLANGPQKLYASCISKKEVFWIQREVSPLV